MKKHLKWIIPAAVVVLVVCVFGYLKLFAWNPERQKLAQINTRHHLGGAIRPGAG